MGRGQSENPPSPQTFEVIVRKGAEREIQEIGEQYENERHGLGETFVFRLHESFERLCRTPFMHAEVIPGVYRTKVHGFPYWVFYAVRSNKVQVFAVVHERRHERTWRKHVPRWAKKDRP